MSTTLLRPARTARTATPSTRPVGAYVDRDGARRPLVPGAYAGTAPAVAGSYVDRDGRALAPARVGSYTDRDVLGA
ncbi:hypothetical protein [Vallicoccus soli]|uniref:Uncharacterized protein n=1 Tax=Vallicoccus soli TaxID=2339232 RepID=A0A3A3ZL52_9ACTN|nr:hypothetical protein [Vallicoccus soli]RJK96866.1 hypothetical protein D5H78_06290 [Vallicoccus soli]